MWLQVLKFLLFSSKQPTDSPTGAPSLTPTSGAPSAEPTEVDIGLLEDGTFNCTSPAISKNDCKNAPYCEWDKNSCFDVTPEPTTSPSETPTKFPSELPTSSPLSSPPTLRPSELPTSSQVKIMIHCDIVFLFFRSSHKHTTQFRSSLWHSPQKNQ